MPRNECQFHPDRLFQPWKIGSTQTNGVLKVQKVFFEEKEKNCFLNIKQSFRRHTMLLLPNVSHYHSEYFCLKFMAVWVCFPSNLSLSKEPLLICNLEKYKFPTDIRRQLLPSITNSAFKWNSFFLVFNLNLFVLYSRSMHFYFHCLLYFSC